MAGTVMSSEKTSSSTASVTASPLAISLTIPLAIPSSFFLLFRPTLRQREFSLCHKGLYAAPKFQVKFQVAVFRTPVYNAALRNTSKVAGFAQERTHVRAVDTRELARQAGAADARLSRRQGVGGCRGAACELSAAGVRGRGAQSEKGAWPRCRRRSLSLAGRRLS